MQYSEGEAIQRSTKVNACHNAIFQNDDGDTIKCFFLLERSHLHLLHSLMFSRK